MMIITSGVIRRFNNLDRRARIYVGQKLRIGTNAKGSQTYAQSESDKDTFTYKVKKGDSVWEIARRFGTTTGNLRRLNGLSRNSKIYPGQRLIVSGTLASEDAYQVYTVRKGDTLWEIAALYNTTVARLRAWNDVSNPSKIKAGDKLIIYTN